jgi:hypothetical protein
MRTLIGVSFITTLLSITVLSTPAALDPALILYFTFEEQLDGRQVEDMTGNGNNGKLRFGAKITNEPAEVQKGVGALKLFNNISAQLRVDEFDRMDKYEDNTYAFWLYIFNPMGARSSILKKANVLVGEEKGSAPGIFLTHPGLALEYRFDDQGADAVGPAGKGQGFELETWYHIAGVKKASDLTIYINGERKGNFKVKRDFNQGKGQLRIGGTTSRAASFSMDEFQMYDRALTEKEIALVFKGIFLSVEPQAKLTTTWGRLKTGR